MSVDFFSGQENNESPLLFIIKPYIKLFEKFYLSMCIHTKT